MVWYTYQMEGLLTCVVEENIVAFQTADALQTALANQKGFVSCYFIEGNPKWLEQLEKHRDLFSRFLQKAHAIARSELEKSSVERIAEAYHQYITAKDQVIEYYKSGKRQAGAKLHQTVRDSFFRILDLCEQYKDLHSKRIQQLQDRSRSQARELRLAAALAMVFAFSFAILLALVLVGQIFGPLHRLALETHRERQSGEPAGETDNEIASLSRSVHGLMEEYDLTHFELVKSRESLWHAEKMAAAGKLAAHTAHRIRNPLTSVKMRLFSLSRSLEVSPDQREDLDVISQEIRHIDTIVQNFLEFSRPPKLKMQNISLSDVIDMTIQLLSHRLETYNVDIRIEGNRNLPQIKADPEQLKEVFVNIMVNACEAMPEGGQITIYGEEADEEDYGRVVRIRITDTGPGIPAAVRQKILEPFFTTKEEGTGLGLSIAARIVGQHGGRLEILPGKGATFAITLPVKESET